MTCTIIIVTNLEYIKRLYVLIAINEPNKPEFYPLPPLTRVYILPDEQVLFPIPLTAHVCSLTCVRVRCRRVGGCNMDYNLQVHIQKI